MNDGLKGHKATLLNNLSTVTLVNKDIAEIRIKEDVDYELNDALHTTSAVEQLDRGEKLFYLTIYGDQTIPSPEARIYCISASGSRFKAAEAIVIRSLSQKMVFNFMNNVDRPLVETKLFSNSKDAQAWLSSFKRIAKVNAQFSCTKKQSL